MAGLKGRSGPPGNQNAFRHGLLLFGFCMFGLAMGSLLSPYGFGWFLLAMAVVLYLVAKAGGRLLSSL
jgi:uncharacterized membrane protein YccC